MATILSIAQDCARRLQITSTFTSFVGSTSNNLVLLRAMIDRTTRELRNEFEWPELQKEYTFNIVSNQDAYALPADFDRAINETRWNRTQRWPMIGPIDAVEWQQYKSGLVVSLPRQRFRLKGFAINQFYVDPVPTSDLSNQLLVYEYISRDIARPTLWVSGATVAATDSCFYDGNIFTHSSGTTLGVNPPRVGIDGTVIWKSIPIWVASTDVQVGQLINASGNVYYVSVAGQLGSSQPVFTSGSATNGTTTLVFIATPSAWAAGIQYTNFVYTASNNTATGNLVLSNSSVLYCLQTGLSGVVAPNFATSLAGITTCSDGTVTWTLFSGAYENFLSDTDESILDSELIIDGATWRFKQESGWDYQDLKALAEDQKNAAKTRIESAGVLTVNRTRVGSPMIGIYSYPEGNFGI